MVKPVLTLAGMMDNYPEITDKLAIPDGMDKDTIIDYIYMYAGANESRYGNPHILSRLFHRFFASRKSEWGRMWIALQAEYNPIENTDRYETFNRKFTSDNEEKNTSEVSGESGGNSTRTPNITTENKRSAFDSNQYQPLGQATESGTETTNSSSNAKQSGSEDKKQNRKDEEGHELHSHGNIGVTTNQEMITEELELRKYNLYKTIALEVEDEFTITVYERRCNEYGML